MASTLNIAQPVRAFKVRMGEAPPESPIDPVLEVPRIASDTSAPKEEVTEGELTFWNSIKDSGNPDMFRAYLNKYPNGTYVELAQINIGAEGP